MQYSCTDTVHHHICHCFSRHATPVGPTLASRSQEPVVALVLLWVMLKLMPVPMVARSMAWVFGRLLAEMAGSNFSGNTNFCFVECRHVKVFASGWSLVQRSAAESGLSKCDREASPVWKPWSTVGCCATRDGGVVLKLMAALSLLAVVTVTAKYDHSSAV